jgi:hypothetical protein
MMIGGLRHIAWDDPTEAIPAFLTSSSCRSRSALAALFLARYAWRR